MPRFGLDLTDWFTSHSEQVQHDLTRYFGGGKSPFTGRWFEEFSAMGDPNRFEPSDVLAVEALSVKVPPEAAGQLLITDSERFNSLLRQIPREQNLWEVKRLDVNVGGAADHLHTALRTLPGIEWVTAGKLMASKRPKLIPILDSEVRALIKPPKEMFWVTLHDELSDPAKRSAISDVCKPAPPQVSLLRRIDVALWMAATHGTKLP